MVVEGNRSGEREREIFRARLGTVLGLVPGSGWAGGQLTSVVNGAWDSGAPFSLSCQSHFCANEIQNFKLQLKTHT